MEQPKKYDPYGGFSIVGIVLSDVLPAAAYHPDQLERLKTWNVGQNTPEETRRD